MSDPLETIRDPMALKLRLQLSPHRLQLTTSALARNGAARLDTLRTLC